MTTPEPGSLWKHINGNIYYVLFLANEETVFPGKYPVTVVYQGTNGHRWARPLSEWKRSFTPVQENVE